MIISLYALMIAGGQPVQASPSAVTTAAPAAKERKICRADEARTGTRFQKKTCLTETQWAQRAMKDRTDDLKLIGVTSKETGARPLSSQ